MSAAQHQHGKTALADTAADGQRQFATQQCLVEGQFSSVVAICQIQLAVHGLGIHTDTHGGDLQSPLQHLIPEEDVAVKLPVIIVGSAAVMLGAGLEDTADLHDAGGVVLFDIGLFSFGAGLQIGIHVFQFLGGDEADLRVQLGLQLGIAHMEPVVGGADGLDNGSDDQL